MQMLISENIEEVEDIRQIHPDGPFQLNGWSHIFVSQYEKDRMYR
jgi:hypothetical protein